MGIHAAVAGQRIADDKQIARLRPTNQIWSERRGIGIGKQWRSALGAIGTGLMIGWARRAVPTSPKLIRFGLAAKSQIPTDAKASGWHGSGTAQTRQIRRGTSRVHLACSELPRVRLPPMLTSAPGD